MDPQDTQALEALIEKARDGDAEAFRGIFDLMSDKLFFYALSRTRDRNEALDVVQDTFVELWRGLPRFRYTSDEAFYGFAFTITKRRIFRHYRKKGEALPLEAATRKHALTPEYEDYRHILKHLHALAPKHQDVIKLRYWSGLTFKEIAAVLNIKETTAKVWHHRAIQELKTILDA